MGKIKKVFVDKIIREIPDRNSNRIFIFEDGYGTISVHFRNLKWTLTKEEFAEWQKTFKEAYEKLQKQAKTEL